MSFLDLELVRIAKRILDISELGLLLKFEGAEVDAYEKENEKDLMVKKGTKNMLKEWNKRTGSTKEKLVEALKLCDMENLAQDVERGTILTEKHRVFMQQDEQPSETVTPIPTVKGSFEDILKKVAKKVVQNSEIDDLGSALGFCVEERKRYIATNCRYQNITNDGTLEMLRDWRKKQTESTERSALKSALEASKNIYLADELFGEGTTQATSVGIPSQGASAADVKVSTPKARDAVSDKKLNTLATHVPHDKYSDLSNRLGIEFNPAQGILTKLGNNYMKAIRECLGIWKDKTGGSTAELKEILVNAEIGSLVEHLE